MPEIVGQKIGPIGYGLMGLTFRSPGPSDEQALAAMHTAVEAGSNCWNGGEFYGPPENNSLTLLRKYYDKYPEDADKVVLNIKGGLRPGMKPDGSPEFLRESISKSLETLGPKGKIAMYECARRDPNTPLEQTLTALADLVKEGKIGGVALSEVSAKTIREAAKITQIVAVEVELSLWSTDPLNNGIVAACAELNIPILAYSPIGKGMLTGQIKSYDDLPEKDPRRNFPRFQPENFDVNLKLVKELETIALRKSCTSAQLALGWLVTLSKKPGVPTIIPIPGATDVDRVKENSTVIELSAEEMREIENILGRTQIVGDRYHAHGMKLVNG